MHKLRLPILATLAALALDASSAPLFRQPLPIDLNSILLATPGPLVASDFNGDGFPDLVYPHPDGRLFFFASQAGGPFAPASITTVPDSIGAMVAADVNADGDNDLVYRRGLQLGVFLGNGDGTFTPGPAGPLVAYGPIAVGDLNGDGKLDVAAAAANSAPGMSPELSWHLGNGAGSFNAGAKISLGFAFASDLVLSDLNGDGRADVIVNGSYVRAFLTGPNAVSLQEVWNQSGSRFALARLNADSRVDLVIRSSSPGSGSSTLDVFLGQGNGTFTANGTQLRDAEFNSPFGFGDVDGDNVQDLVTVGDGVAVARGLGDGTFAEPLVTAAAGLSQFVLGDFDHDGERDIVTNSSNLTASLHFARGNGNGTFDEDRGYPVGVANGGMAEGISALDMNGDGKPDATTLVFHPDGTRTISVLRNDGSGGLLPPVVTPTSVTGTLKAFLFGSLDGNSAPDVVAILTTETGVTATPFLGNGNAGFTPAASLAITTDTTFTFTARLADVTGDGEADLLVNGDIYEGNGNGTFDAARSTGVLFSVIGDVDGNGTADAIWRDSSLRLSVALNSGGGNFAAPTIVGTDVGFPAAFADFDGDDIADLFCVTSRGTSVFPGNGNGTFDAPVTMAIPGRSWSNARVADFDDDGDLDVLLKLEILLGNGDGRFRSLERGGYGSNGQPEVADFNGDGQLDVLSVSNSIAIVHLLGLVPEPTRATTTSLHQLTPPQHATPTVYHAVTAGSLTPVTGATLFTINGVPFGLAELSATKGSVPITASVASMTHTLALGTYPMIAKYLGSATFLSSTDVNILSVERAATSLALDGPTFGEYGTTFDLGWTLTAPSVAGMAQPTNLYTLKENGVDVPNVQWLGDHARIKGLSAGVHTLTLAYEGDTHFKPSSLTIDVNIAKRHPELVFEPLPQGTARLAGPVTLVAKFNPDDYGAFTGTVAFSVDGTAAGTLAVNAGRAEQEVTLAAGRYSIGINYSGDANNEPVNDVWVMYVYAPAGTAPAVIAQTSGGLTYLRWIPSADAASYVVYQRTLFANGWTVVRNAYVPETVVIVPSEKTWMFAVAPRYADMTIGPKGPPDIATSVALTDDPVAPGTPIRVLHILQLRTAVNAVRTFAGLTAFSFNDGSMLPGAPIRAMHLTELRDALTAARTAIGMPMSFSPEPPAPGTVVKSTHVEEIRAGVR